MKNGRERFKSKALLKKKNKTNKDIKHEMASLEFGVKRLQANGVCVCVWTWGLVSMPNGHKETKKSCF